MKNYERDGLTIDHTPSVAVASGTLVLIGGVAAVALADIAANQTGAAIAVGVAKLPSASATTAAQGADAYVTPGGQVTGASSGNTRIGRFWEAKLNGQTIAVVKLNVP